MFRGLGVVSQTFHELSKIISRKYTMPEITFMMRISSWNFVCVPNMLWTHVQNFSLKFSQETWFLQHKKFWQDILESLRNVSDPPWNNRHLIDLLSNFALTYYLPFNTHMILILVLFATLFSKEETRAIWSTMNIKMYQYRLYIIIFISTHYIS